MQSLFWWDKDTKIEKKLEIRLGTWYLVINHLNDIALSFQLI